MFSCDYNGWADVPEEEREGIDCFELSESGRTAQFRMTLVIAAPEVGRREVSERRAA